MKTWDVVICGGGLAGLCAALQLRRFVPELEVLVLERQAEDPPDACYKVGESCVEGATHWLAHTLGLGDYLERNHVKKLGLRFFGGGGHVPFHERFEIGVSDFPPVDSFQLDRGRFERDLRGFVREAGATLELGVEVRAIEIASPHRITVRGVGERQTRQIAARWLVDATGRRRRLARTLGLRQPSPHRAGACWFRVEGQRDIAQLVDARHVDWHGRTLRPRWHSTNHLLGRGYWVWLIPLSSGHTSIGIVADESIHPTRHRSTEPRARAWLAEHEPQLGRWLEGVPCRDFGVMPMFAHHITRAFSTDRWACIGEAAAFVDPLYSVGSDLIAWSCSSLVTLVRLDHQGALDGATVELYDSLFRETVDWITGWYQGAYPVFGHDRVMLHKLLWDALAYFMAPARVLLHRFLDSPGAMRRYAELMRPFYALDRQVQGLFGAWASRSEPRPAPPGHYLAGPACPDLQPLAALDTSMGAGFRFLDQLPGSVETMRSLAAALGAQAERACGLASALGPAPPGLLAQLEVYLGAGERGPGVATFGRESVVTP